jgi:hypothetical protein
MRKLTLVAALVLAVSATPALALFGPMPVIDLDSITKLATQVENQATMIENQVAMLKNEATNLTRIPTSYQDVNAKISAVAATSKAVAAEARGTVAAGTVVSDSSEEAAETARLNGLASSANGAQQQAIVQNGYLAQQNNLLEQGNVLQAQGQLQHAAEVRAGAQAFVDAGAAVRNAINTNAAGNLP